MLFHLSCLLNFMLNCVMGMEVEFDLEVATNTTKEKFLQHGMFYYFAYATNMLERRLRVKCPDAWFLGAALLQDHRLDFTMEVPWWKGAVATICKEPGTDVWGVLWAVRIVDMDKLDEQEGVSAGWYHQKEVIVQYEGNLKLKAITYVQNHSPRKIDLLDSYPIERLPSLTYLQVMILGATQGGISDEYIRYLYSIPHNGREATEEMNRFINAKTHVKLLL